MNSEMQCLVSALFRLVLIFHQFLLCLSRFPPVSRPVPWFLVLKDGHVPPLASLYAGPYKILARSLRTFRLQVGTRVEVVSVQRLKHAITTEDETPALPPRRGRPVRLAPPVPSSPPLRHAAVDILVKL